MPPEPAGAPTGKIDLYWRPSCGFCRRLMRDIDEIGLNVELHNIWEDDEAAAVVRSYARGNETVPTVVIGSIGLVNPNIKELVAAVVSHAPHLLGTG